MTTATRESPAQQHEAINTPEAPANSPIPSPVFSTPIPLTSNTAAAADKSMPAEKDHHGMPPASLHPPWSALWLKDYTMICIVFAITGSSTVKLVRPLLSSVFGLEGTMWDGPTVFRIAYFFTTFPVYSMILIAVGTLFGRGPYFKAIARRMWSRILPFLKNKKNIADEKK
ncbi:hypothetical protein BC832DRAFT_541027 [Gaertneriomyces semiglobifer]|nr:hypothetical protein BC832DRAFT_541027 [Gaertneriomyces semiglobifer]